MNIDESNIVENMDEERALACLLAAGECMIITHDDTVKIYINTSDMFAWGCADCEPIQDNDGDEPSDIIECYKLWKQYPKWGATHWACYKRNQQPQGPVKKRMIEDGEWNESLEALPENHYDKALKEHFESKKNT